MQCRRPRFHCWVRKIPWRRERQPTLVFLPVNSIDRGAWRATVHRVAKSWTRLNDSHTIHSSTEKWGSLDPVPPAQGVFFLSKMRSDCQASVSDTSPGDTCSQVWGHQGCSINQFTDFSILTIWKTGSGWGEKARWLPSKSSKLKRPEWRQKGQLCPWQALHKGDSKPERSAEMRKRQVSRNTDYYKIKSIVSLKGRGFPETFLFLSTPKLSALSICYFSHWGKSIVKRNSLAFMRKNKW